MPRRNAATKRDILPDPKFNSIVVAKLINQVMLDGKKSVAQNIVYSAFEKAGEKYFGSYINGYPIDVYELLKYLNVVKGWNIDKQNLWRYVEMFKLKIEGQEFHNSMSDILYTRQLFYLINQNYIK